MATARPATVDQYLASLPPDRRAALARVTETIRKNLRKGFEEGLLYGMPSWYVPLARYPDTYNGQPIGLVGLASQKQYMSLYLNCVYMDAAMHDWFVDAYAKSGKRLDMGKSCVRFKALEDLPLDVVGKVIGQVTVDKLLAWYEAGRAATKRGKSR